VPRTIVYDTPLAQAAMESAEPSQKRRPTGPPAEARRKANDVAAAEPGELRAEAVSMPVKDDYTAKIAKYVPGEVVSVSIAGFAAFDPTGNWVWVGLVLGILANLVYLFGTAGTLQAASRPRVYFYALSCLAFVFWAAATIPQVRDAFGLGDPGDEQKASYLLVAAAFLLPALDTFFDRLELRGRAT
jgi:hypothetical protein